MSSKILDHLHHGSRPSLITVENSHETMHRKTCMHVWELCDQHVQGLRLDRLAVAAKVQSFTEAGLLLYDIQHDRNRLAQIRPLGGAL